MRLALAALALVAAAAQLDTGRAVASTHRHDFRTPGRTLHGLWHRSPLVIDAADR